MNIERIIIGTLDGTWKEAIVLDEKNRGLILTDRNEIIDKLSSFAINKGIKIEELLADKDKVKKIDIRSEEYRVLKEIIDVKEEEKPLETKPSTEDKPIVAPIEVTKDDEPTKEENKKKGIKFKYIAAGTVLAGALLFGCVLIHNSNLTDEEKARRKNNKIYTQTYDNDFTVTRHSGSANEKFNDNLDKTYANIDDFTNQVLRIDDRIYTEDQINALVNQINRMAVSDVTELERVLNGKKMSGDNYQVSFEDFFDHGTYEYVSVGKFVTARNKLINNAYKKNATKASVKKEMTSFLNSLNRFVLCVEPIKDTDIYYSDLNPTAKYVITAFLKAYIQPSALNYSITINGEKYTRKELLKDAEIWNSQAYEMMLQEYATKRR